MTRQPAAAGLRRSSLRRLNLAQRINFLFSWFLPFGRRIVCSLERSHFFLLS
jgi:hypothetical protein